MKSEAKVYNFDEELSKRNPGAYHLVQIRRINVRPPFLINNPNIIESFIIDYWAYIVAAIVVLVCMFLCSKYI